MATYNYDAINAKLQQAKAQERARLLASIQGQLAGLDGQISDINSDSTKARSNVYTGARVSAIGNNEILASKGLSGGLYQNSTSGVSETSRIAENLNLRLNLSGLDRQRASQIQQVKNQKSSLESNKIAGFADIEARFNTKEAEALQEYEQKQQEQANLDSSLAEDKRRFEIEQAFNEQKRLDELQKASDLKDYNEFIAQKEALEIQARKDAKNKSELLNFMKSSLQGYAGGATSASTKALDSLSSKLNLPELGLTEAQKTEYFDYVVNSMGFDAGFITSYKNWVASGRTVWR